MAQRRSVLSSRTSRAALPYSDAPEWEIINPGLRLGYRRGRGSYGRGGSWLAASRLPDGTRIQTKLGRADDATAADGNGVLSHEQAKDAARAWQKALKVGSDAPAALTVNDALDRYFEARAAEGMKSIDDAKTRAAFHIRPKLGSIKVADLTIEKVRTWRDGMVTAQKRLRTGKFAKKANVAQVDLADPEVIRRRRDTANRTLTTLKAALNWAFNNRLVADDTAWRLVKPYRGTTSARVRFLSPDEQKALIGASNGAIRDLVSAALVTGARFGELARLRVSDYDAANKSVFVAESKSGKPRHIPLPAGGAELFERLATGRPSGEPLLRRESGAAWAPSTYNRSWKALLAQAKLSDVTLHEIRHTYASTMVRNGAPLIIVAEALGHSDTRMAEKHYAHLAPSYVADTIRRLAPDI
ncbi:site-specific integrase [Mesorhizobium sp. M2A.F.Ca.ET.029.05.1.1]|uniref:tyrosine-type recombinase/integrase n=1 Tax=unclassified Mesorhizobium TaxID=325217 RepID=UPI000FCADABA|nr:MULTISPECIES: site-specific integrase [unclassified Mesorhizobium]RVC97437.1 site-specific integrase [Mesorhizobium sp. M2A.F.Ca.ET.017.03.2.1]RVD10598.1 site-specific integrase [Mesorhizobium sp. M2A.F.Ca.ET.029.05.1.1]TIW58901.1 MAG: site-specific integrase [Mesorhizobium sp.]